MAVLFADQYSKRTSERAKSVFLFSNTTETNGEMPLASRCKPEKKIWRTWAKFTTCSSFTDCSHTRRKSWLLLWCLKNTPDETSSPALPPSRRSASVKWINACDSSDHDPGQTLRPERSATRGRLLDPIKPGDEGSSPGSCRLKAVPVRFESAGFPKG